MTVMTAEVFDPTDLCPRCHLCSIPAGEPPATLCPLCARHLGSIAPLPSVGSDRPALRYEGTDAAVAGRARAAATVARRAPWSA